MIRLTVTICVSLCLIACNGADQVSSDPANSAYFTDSDRMIEIGGQSVRYRESGPATGPTLLMLHGFTDSLHTWDALAAELDTDFHILRPDLPGHGLSGLPAGDDYSNEALTAFVGDFLDATKTSEAIIVGNSLGGLAAWRYAALDPDRVSGLALLAPGGVPHNGVGETPLEAPMMLRFYLENAPKAGVRTALQTMHGDTTRVTDAMVTRFADLMAMPGNGDAFVARAERFTLPDPAGDMAKVEAPTLILWGAKDTVLPPEHADIFAEHMPHASVRILDQVGHMPQSEAVDEVATAIRTLAARTGNGS
ncbi:alpha/beta fold hydrolase [Algimonas porphyrae]|uniref:Alpha/beta hydrolase n=1 Tax=Algimonas porphyrae TaxID=1128113 RepID=A0ABQ5V1N7_9PROT|nr:alpha/beta fold hydrolase [Algimonas porphyrae]GLQ21465.1 alpha/beta hydrolase [Algimonas porphyrae]